MGYLNIGSLSLTNFSQGVISLFFNVPAASIAAQIAAPPGGPGSFLETTIPLLTWGVPQTQSANPDLAGIDPSYIGLYCDPSSGNAYLSVNLQTGQHATATGFYYSGPVGNPGVYTDITQASIDVAQPEFYFVNSWYGSVPAIEPDVWHNVIVSFDLTAVASSGPPYNSDPLALNSWSEPNEGVISTSTLWYALDDVNYNASGDLDPYSLDVDGSQAILTQLGYFIAGATTGPSSNGAGDSGYIPATYSLSSPVLPSNGGPIGIPASPQYVSSIYSVRLAELQVFTGVTMDTAVMANRRAFIDAEGNPVAPNTPITGSIAVLGQQPAIALTGRSQNWIMGKNGGMSGGDFTPTGSITTVVPGASVTPIA